MASASLPAEFFTTASFTTLLGLTGITLVLRNTLHSAFGWSRPWLGLLIALAVTELGVMFTDDPSARAYAIGLLNGCLVFLTAGGSAAALSFQTDQKIVPHSVDDRVFHQRFFDKWF